jgi:hypothetical protein
MHGTPTKSVQSTFQIADMDKLFVGGQCRSSSQVRGIFISCNQVGHNSLRIDRVISDDIDGSVPIVEDA